VAPLDRGFNQPAHQRGRFARHAGALRLDRADDRRFERRLVFLEVHRDLLVGHAPQERTHEQQVREQREGEADHDARGDNRLRGEAHPLESPRGQHEGRAAARRCQRRAADEKLSTPPPANIVNDGDKLLVHMSLTISQSRSFRLQAEGSPL
jgi:hypothetical protein